MDRFSLFLTLLKSPQTVPLRNAKACGVELFSEMVPIGETILLPNTYFRIRTLGGDTLEEIG
jgi:hypothetical protein